MPDDKKIIGVNFDPETIKSFERQITGIGHGTTEEGCVELLSVEGDRIILFPFSRNSWLKISIGKHDYVGYEINEYPPLLHNINNLNWMIFEITKGKEALDSLGLLADLEKAIDSNIHDFKPTAIVIPESDSLRERYLADPSKCPFCNSSDISGDSVELGNGHAWQAIECSACEKSWQDIYTLTDIEVIEDLA